MTTIKILIVEDDYLQATVLKEKIEGLNLKVDMEILDITDSVDETMPLLEKYSPGIAVLDIELHDDSDGGIRIAQEIQNRNLDTVTIFLTGLDDEIGYEKAKHIKHFRFLRKGYDDDALYRAVNSAVIELQTAREKNDFASLQQQPVVFYKPFNEDVVWVKVGKTGETKNLRVRTSDIVYLESDDHYVELYIVNSEKPLLVNLGGLKAFFEINLSSPPFYQVNRKYVINSNYISHIVGNCIYIKHRNNKEIEIPVGPSYRHILKAIMNQ